MSTTLPLDVRVKRHILAAPERVFDAWIDPTSVAQWFAPGMGEMTRIDVDARAGGRFVFTQRRNGEDVEHTGEYFVFDRPHRLAFTWSAPRHSPLVTRVGIEIRPGEHGTDLTLTHEVLPQFADAAERVKESWTTMIEALARLVE